MIESLIVTLREGIEIALVVGITLSYLKKINQPQWARPVWWGFFWAIVASIAGAFFLERLPIEEEVYEGILYLVAALFVGSMIVWMARTAKYLKQNIQAKVDQALNTEEKAKWRGALALGVFTFFMVFREGAETVLFLSALSLKIETWANFLGGILGLGLATLFGVGFVRGTVRIDLARFFKVTEVVLLLFVGQLLVNGFHELEEAGWLVIGSQMVQFLDTVAKNQLLMFTAILLLPILFLSIPASKSKKVAPP